MEKLLREILREDVPQVPNLQQKTRQHLAGIKADTSGSRGRWARTTLRPVTVVSLVFMLVVVSFISTLTLISLWGDFAGPAHGSFLAGHPEIIQAQESLPYGIVYPVRLPEGFELTSVDVVGTRLTMSFQDGDAQLDIIQTIIPLDIAGAEDEFQHRGLTVFKTVNSDGIVSWTVEKQLETHYIYYVSALELEIPYLAATGSWLSSPQRSSDRYIPLEELPDLDAYIRIWLEGQPEYSHSLSLSMVHGLNVSVQEENPAVTSALMEWARQNNREVGFIHGSNSYRITPKVFTNSHVTFGSLFSKLVSRPFEHREAADFELLGIISASGEGITVNKGWFLTTYALDIKLETADLLEYENLQEVSYMVSMAVPKVSTHNADTESKLEEIRLEWTLVPGQVTTLRARGWYLNRPFGLQAVLGLLIISLAVLWVSALLWMLAIKKNTKAIPTVFAVLILLAVIALMISILWPILWPNPLPRSWG